MITWKPIVTFDGDDGDLVDLWFDVYASPRSMGMADAWRAVECWRQGGKWFDGRGELVMGYITHWAPILPPPSTAPSDTDSLETAAPELLKGARALINWSNHHLPDCLLCGTVDLESEHGPDCPVELAAQGISMAVGTVRCVKG